MPKPKQINNKVAVESKIFILEGKMSTVGSPLKMRGEISVGIRPLILFVKIFVEKILLKNINLPA
jgi:hypothetical protein